MKKTGNGEWSNSARNWSICFNFVFDTTQVNITYWFPIFIAIANIHDDLCLIVTNKVTVNKMDMSSTAKNIIRFFAIVLNFFQGSIFVTRKNGCSLLHTITSNRFARKIALSNNCYYFASKLSHLVLL